MARKSTAQKLAEVAQKAQEAVEKRVVTHTEEELNTEYVPELHEAAPVPEVPVTDANPLVTTPPPKTREEYRAISDSTEGWLQEAEADLLVRTAEKYWNPNSQWLEIGSFKGRSTVLLAGVLAANEAGWLQCVDPMEGDLSYPSKWGANGTMDTDRIENVGSTLEAFRETINKANLNSYVTLYECFITDHVPPSLVDLCFYDGLHDYQSILSDYSYTKQFLASNAILIFHDFTTWAGPHQVVTDAVAIGELEILEQAESLIVCRFLGAK